MRKCPKCNYDADDSVRFCVNCGVEMPDCVQDKSEVVNNDIKNLEYKGRQPTFLGLVIPFGMFFIMGCFMLCLMVIAPLYNIIQTRNLVETPCVIKSGELKSDRNSNGETAYNIYIAYTYKVNGVEYTSERYKFIYGFSSDYKRQKQLIDNYPPGRKSICYIDPKNPENAVYYINPKNPGNSEIERKFTSEMFWMSIVFTVFIFIGIGGVYAAFRAKARGEISFV